MLRSEIAAFYSGFGQPSALRTAFTDAVLIVPLTPDDRVYVHQLGGIDWLCAFTSVEQFALYMTARGVEPEREYRYHTLLGQRILDSLITQRPRPTGVAVDIAGAAPMAFPPELPEQSEVG
ncbi:hypothetical protein ACFYO1_03070 [Nocardia sp. NPDC006044]|uniref:hypothetical protein n=1 Tax=Nocardia sp. NPDC006044 TaxID=3364306 RepID=UPI00369239A0